MTLIYTLDLTLDLTDGHIQLKSLKLMLITFTTLWFDGECLEVYLSYISDQSNVWAYYKN